jgi:predicted alpha/beta hydrolase
MKIWYYFAAMLILCGTILPASSQEQIALTIYVHDGDLDGELLTGVKISGQDASGNEFEQATDASGAAVVQGEPGIWQFAFQKAGYDKLFLAYNATQTEVTAAYLEKNDTTDLVALTIYVHDGNLNGELLTGVEISGQDASGNEFEQATDANGAAVVQGEPGIWQFAFQKAGYDNLYLKYNATQTEETAAYLEKTA